jgi:hypothetical protein
MVGKIEVGIPGAISLSYQRPLQFLPTWTCLRCKIVCEDDGLGMMALIPSDRYPR